MKKKNALRQDNNSRTHAPSHRRIAAPRRAPTECALLPADLQRSSSKWGNPLVVQVLLGWTFSAGLESYSEVTRCPYDSPQAKTSRRRILYMFCLFSFPVRTAWHFFGWNIIENRLYLPRIVVSYGTFCCLFLFLTTHRARTDRYLQRWRTSTDTGCPGCWWGEKTASTWRTTRTTPPPAPPAARSIESQHSSQVSSRLVGWCETRNSKLEKPAAAQLLIAGHRLDNADHLPRDTWAERPSPCRTAPALSPGRKPRPPSLESQPSYSLRLSRSCHHLKKESPCPCPRLHDCDSWWYTRYQVWDFAINWDKVHLLRLRLLLLLLVLQQKTPSTNDIYSSWYIADGSSPSLSLSILMCRRQQ